MGPGLVELVGLILSQVIAFAKPFVHRVLDLGSTVWRLDTIRVMSQNLSLSIVLKSPK
jgi:hypothetical protein